jgi:hypothetical protein
MPRLSSPLSLRLSLRYKIPLRVTALVVLVAISVTAAIVLRQVNQARGDLDRYSSSLARALANTLQPYVRHDDVWRAYEIVRAATDDANTPAAASVFVIVTDSNGTIFVSSRPREYPVGVRVAAMGADFGSFVAQRAAGKASEAACSTLRRSSPTACAWATSCWSRRATRCGRVTRRWSSRRVS